MRLFTTFSLPALAVVWLMATAVQAKTTIVVDFSPHPSAEAAAGSEAEVDWLDADVTDDTVCTECFAAVELQHYLRKMTGRAEEYRIVDDGEMPEGDLILVGLPSVGHGNAPPSHRRDVQMPHRMGRRASNAASRKLVTALRVDKEQLAAMGREGYCITTASLDGRRVTLLAGATRVGTLYAAYDLLYRHGWPQPNSWSPGFSRLKPVLQHARTTRLSLTGRP